MNGIPILAVSGDCIARAWENSLIRLFEAGCDIRTQYDRPGDPPSKDATMAITVEQPLQEPMIHRDFPGGFEDLQEYVMEVVRGNQGPLRSRSERQRRYSMIHRDFPGGFEELQEYVMEVCDGIKDHCVRDPNDPTDTRWEYTYHQRLFGYEVPDAGGRSTRSSTSAGNWPRRRYTRRAQAITWKVWEDKRLLRSGLPAEHLVPDHGGGRAAAC